MLNRHFRRGQSTFLCRHCGRRSRDVDGGNGGVELCPECDQGCMSENGASDTSDPVERERYERDAREWFQRAVDKGGRIPGFIPTAK
jgi:hypothetical protein